MIWKSLILIAALFFASCAGSAGFYKLDDMGEAQFERYTSRVAVQAGAIATVARAEDDISAESLRAIAATLRSIADGNAVAALTEALDLEGYGSLALTIAATELDYKLEQRGGYDGGILSARARAVLVSIADALDGAAPQRGE